LSPNRHGRLQGHKVANERTRHCGHRLYLPLSPRTLPPCNLATLPQFATQHDQKVVLGRPVAVGDAFEPIRVAMP
jgi:hypothetical protein